MFQDIGQHKIILFQFLRRQRVSLSVCNRQRQLRLVAKKCSLAPSQKGVRAQKIPQLKTKCGHWQVRAALTEKQTRDCADKMEKETREKQTLMRLDSDKNYRGTDMTNWHPHITNQTYKLCRDPDKTEE